MQKVVIGVDLGGTQTKVGIVDKSGKILYKKIIYTLVKEGRERVTSRISETIMKLLEDSGFSPDDIEAIGVGSPGSIDHETGTVLFSPNLPDWVNFCLAETLTRNTGFETFVENDANAFILGEWAFGNHRNLEHMIGLTLGTGVGGGVISHGKLVVGKNGFDGELGHVIVEPGVRLCGCGSHGCLESLASATGMAGLRREYQKRFPDSPIYAGAEITPKIIFDNAKNGDELSTIICDRVTTALAIAISNFTHIFNPQAVIIGGGISRAGSILIDNVNKKLPR